MNKAEILNEHIAAIDRHFRETRPGQSANERLFSRLTKLMEEVGEVSEAVLQEAGEQRNNKEKCDLDSELADVLITALLLAATREKDIWDGAIEILERFRKKHTI
jgi:NTP pyrophosphatase (non-canonical NTP hydrolase)